MAMSDVHRYPLKLYLIKYELVIHVLLFLKLFIFICGFSAKKTCAFFANETEEFIRIKHFSNQKTTLFSTFFCPIKVSRPKGTVVNLTLPSLQGLSIEIMLTVPLRKILSVFYIP